MNTCILMAKIVSNPELRYTTDSQLALSQMLIEFAGVGQNDPPAIVKAVGWGNLATEIEKNYHQGEEVIIHGRLKMNTIDRPEGFKEKKAELTVSHIYKLNGGMSTSVSNSTPGNSSNVVPLNRNNPSTVGNNNYPDDNFQEEGHEENLDDIPF